MEWWEYLIFIVVQLGVGLCGAWLYSHIKQDARNSSDIEYSEDISELKEQGKNTATKRDIEEITEKIEIVRAEVSLEKQREHEFIKERHEHMMNLLKYVEEVDALSGLLIFLMYDISAKDRLANLVDKLNRTQANINHELRMCHICINDTTITDKLYDIQPYVREYNVVLCKIASNTTVRLYEYHYFRDAADRYNSPYLMSRSSTAMEEIRELRKEYERTKENESVKADDSLTILISEIVKLYEQKFHIKLNYQPPQIKENDTI